MTVNAGMSQVPRHKVLRVYGFMGLGCRVYVGSGETPDNKASPLHRDYSRDPNI